MSEFANQDEIAAKRQKKMIILKVKSTLNINRFVGKKIADCGNNTTAI